MTMRIEVLDVGPNSVRVAFYYPVKIAVRLAAATDPNRVPAGSRLTPAEAQALKAGALFELVKTISTNGLDKATVQAFIERLWSDNLAEAARTYDLLYRNKNLIGKAYDGTSWS